MKLRVTEGVSGNYFYHLAEEDKYKALCGASVMSTNLPLEHWGHEGFIEGPRYKIPYKWCATCASKWEEELECW